MRGVGDEGNNKIKQNQTKTTPREGLQSNPTPPKATNEKNKKALRPSAAEEGTSPQQTQTQDADTPKKQREQEQEQAPRTKTQQNNDNTRATSS